MIPYGRNFLLPSPLLVDSRLVNLPPRFLSQITRPFLILFLNEASSHTFCPAFVQVNEAILKTTPVGARDVPAAGNSVALLTSAAEDFLRVVSPMACHGVSEHPSAAHSVDGFEAMMRRFSGEFPSMSDMSFLLASRQHKRARGGYHGFQYPIEGPRHHPSQLIARRWPHPATNPSCDLCLPSSTR